MVLYYLLLRGWLHLGDSVLFIRSLSVIFATAAVPAIFVLGRKVAGIAVGLASALLLSVNAFQVRYAQEARSYSLLVLLVILSTYLYLTAFETGRRRDWNWYIAASALAVYAHFFALLIVLSHWVAFGINARGRPSADGDAILPEFRRALKWFAIWTAPVWIFIATTGAGPIGWIRRPRPLDVLRFLQIVSGDAVYPLLWIYVACVLAGVVRIAFARDGERSNLILAACCFFVPLVVVLLVSIARPTFIPRYLILTLPAWIMLAAAGLMWPRPRLLGYVVLVPMVWLSVQRVQAYYQLDFDIGRNDLRGVTHYVLEHAQSGDGIVFYMLQTRFAYDYYAAHQAAGNRPEIVWPGSSSHLGWRDFMGSPATARVPEYAQKYPRLWMVTTSTFIADPKLAAFQSALQQHYRLVATQELPFMHVYLYERP